MAFESEKICPPAKKQKEYSTFQRGFPTVDTKVTGERIKQLRQDRGLSVRDLQEYFGFDALQAIHRWQDGKVIPKVDNLVALSMLLEIRMDEFIVLSDNRIICKYEEPRDDSRGSDFF